jgi:hypothetical protein
MVGPPRLIPLGQPSASQPDPSASLTMEPPGTAVQTAIFAGRARPSGPKSSVLIRRGYALAFT